jgi:hypothetical protein
MPTPTCPACKMEEETIRHLILTCPAWEYQQNILQYKIQERSRSIPKMLSEPNAVKVLLQFIKDTKRLNHIFKLKNIT